MKTSVQTWQSDRFANTRRLHWYITQNQLEAVKWCLENGAFLNALSPAPHSNSALHLAAHHGHNEILKYLLTYSALKINLQDDGGNTALHRASRAYQTAGAQQGKYTETVELLLAANANPLIPNSIRMRANHPFCTTKQHTLSKKMLELVAARNLGELKKFVAAGIDLNFRADITPYSCVSALHIASIKGFYEIVTYLLSQPGINVHIQDNGRESPRQYARFIKCKAAYDNVIHAFNTAMVRAAGAGNLWDLQTHIAHGGDPNFRSNEGGGISALHAASQNGHSHVVSYLLQLPGINRIIQNARTGESPRRYADAANHTHVTYHYDLVMLNHARAGNLSEVNNSLANGTSVNFRGPNGEALMHIAHERADTGMISLALAQPHVNPTIQNAISGVTPLGYAAAAGHLHLLPQNQIQAPQPDENRIRQEIRTQRRRRRRDGWITFGTTLALGPVVGAMAGAAITRQNVLRAGVVSMVTAGFSSVVGSVVNQLAVPMIAREAINAGANGALRTVMYGGNPLHNIVVSAGAAAVGAAVVPTPANMTGTIMTIAVPTARALVQNSVEALVTHGSLETVLTRTASTGLQVAAQVIVQNAGSRIIESIAENKSANESKSLSRTTQEEKKPNNTAHIRTQLSTRNPTVVRPRAPELKNYSAMRRSQRHSGIATSRTSMARTHHSLPQQDVNSLDFARNPELRRFHEESTQQIQETRPRGELSLNIRNIDTTRNNRPEVIDQHNFNHAFIHLAAHRIGDAITHHGGRVLGPAVEIAIAANEMKEIIEHKQSTIEEKVCNSAGVVVGASVSMGGGAGAVLGGALVGAYSRSPRVGLAVATYGLMRAPELGDNARHLAQQVCHETASLLPEAVERLGSSINALTQGN